MAERIKTDYIRVNLGNVRTTFLKFIKVLVGRNHPIKDLLSQIEVRTVNRVT